MLKNLPVIFLLFLSYCSIAFAQLSLKLNVESGYYESESENFDNRKEFNARFDAEIGYEYKSENRYASIKFRGRPEIFGFRDNELKLIKLIGNGNYYFSSENLIWGFNINGQKNNYSGKNVNLNFNNYLFRIESLLKIGEISLSSNLGYGYQNITNDLNQDMDIFLFDIKISHYMLNNFKSGYGVYLEKFILSNLYGNQEIINKGWRAGPQISVNYLKSFIINFDYRFLFHTSDVTRLPSYEQWFRLVAGKLLWNNWSVFLLADYYSRKYTIKDDVSFISLYTPINIDNRIYMKLACSLNNFLETYIKLGYFKENLYNNYSFSGWNILLGFEIIN